MVIDFADAVQKFINSPPGQLAAGGVLAGIVWKFFERVEGLLTDMTKFEIAVWLVGLKTAEQVKTWPDTFIRMFDRVFGTKHLSWKCFGRSCLASYALAAISVLISATVMKGPTPGWTTSQSFHLMEAAIPTLILGSIVGNLIPDFLSLVGTRLALQFLSRNRSFLWSLTVLAANLLATIALATIAARVATWLTVDLRFWHGSAMIEEYRAHNPNIDVNDAAFAFAFDRLPGLQSALFVSENFALLWIFPAFFTSIWLWLYAGSGFLLKAARRFDTGFELFNRKVDIEKKPLSAIGLIAGGLVAVAYWCFAAIVHLVRMPTTH